MAAPEPDAAWVDRLRRRDPAAAGEFLDRFGPDLLAFLARYTGSRTDAEDLFQDVCLRVVERLPEYEQRGRFRGWLYTIAANAARDHMRRLAGEARALRTAAANGPVTAGGDTAMETREALDRLPGALQGLTPEQRAVFLLRTNAGLSFREIAESLGCPLNTALGRMHDAVRRLREALKESTP
jgi:RNA polymerase sigma-70 factor (ECF subfamily)